MVVDFACFENKIPSHKPDGYCNLAPRGIQPAIIIKKTNNYFIPVRDDPQALMEPQFESHINVRQLLAFDEQNAFPNTRQVSQIEHIMELGRCWQHFYLIITKFMRNRFWALLGNDVLKLIV